jgi:hypothetical protein
MAVMADASDRRDTGSVGIARSIELLERWVAGDDEALKEWLGFDPAPDPSGAWSRIVAAAHTLSKAIVPRRRQAPLGERLGERQGRALNKYPAEGR